MKAKRDTGFTLVELLIVIVIISILAAIAIPQFIGSTQDAKTATLKADLTALRNAIELYYHQHSNTYPGAVKGTACAGTAGANDLFVEQLSRYTDANNGCSATKAATHPYGPYLKTGIPDNPLPNVANVTDPSSAAVSAAVAVLTADDAVDHGYVYSTATGEIIANNTTYATY
ncbi:type II secretion system protein [Thermodesulfobacteriota bacterium]